MISQKLQNIVWRTTQIAAKQGVIFVIFLIAARTLSPLEFGLYNYLLAIAFLLVIFSDFGISASSARYIARYTVISPEKKDAVLFNSGLLILGLASVMALLISIYVGIFEFQYFEKLLYVIPLVFTIPLTSLYDGLYRGTGRFKQLSIVSMISGLFSVALSIYLTTTYGLVGAFASLNFFYASLLIGEMLWFTGVRYSFDWDVMKEVGIYAGTVGVIWAAYFLYSRADLLVLGHFGYITEIGYYELINKVSMLLLIPAGIYAQVESPNIVVLHSQDEKRMLLHLFRKHLAVLLSMALVISLITGLLVPFLIAYFLPAMNVSLVILILYVAMALFPFQSASEYIGNTFIVSTGHAMLNMKNVLLFGILNVVLDVYFVSSLGPVGILYSRVISIVLGTISLLVLYHKALLVEVEIDQRNNL